jgi:two-component system phosphate regulon sensor histidine kinase PhoR
MSWLFGGTRGRESTDLQARIGELEAEVLHGERRLSEIIAAFPEPAWVLDSELKTLHWNAALVSLSRKQELSQEDLRMLGAHAWFREPEVRNTLSQTIAMAATGKVQLESSGRYYELSCSPFDGGVIAVFHDITQLKRAEQARLEMVVNVSHELRTPLTAIKGFTDTLVEDLRAGRTQDSREHAAVIARNVNRLLELVQDVLQVSSLESGELPLERRSVSVREVTEAALRSLESVWRSSGHRISTDYGVASVSADRAQVEQVLVNLVGNALRYVPASGGEIRIRWFEDSGHVVLRVEDNGPGIPEDLQSRIFERFFRGDLGRSRDAGGTGLGLAIVKHIVLRHGGTVAVESRPGQGAAFICRF